MQIMYEERRGMAAASRYISIGSLKTVSFSENGLQKLHPFAITILDLFIDVQNPPTADLPFLMYTASEVVNPLAYAA